MNGYGTSKIALMDMMWDSGGINTSFETGLLPILESSDDC